MQRALLVDKNYMALAVIDWKRALRLLVKGKAENVETESKILIQGATTFSLSTILRLVVDIPWRVYQSRLKFSRRNVMIRDDWTCQYCSEKLSKTGGTIDHVIPKAKGGKTDYLNCVASCKSCNNKKANKLLEELGMQLIKKPKKPNFMVMYRKYLNDDLPVEWADYIIGL